MADKPSDIQREELEHALDTVGIDDLNINKLRDTLFRLGNRARSECMYDVPEISEIYICGSFHYGEALDTASDLDVRFVLDSEINTKTSDWLSDYIRRCRNFEISNENRVFGYIDGHFRVDKPDNGTRIY